jgi:iron complex transport system ATP-binding protein
MTQGAQLSFPFTVQEVARLGLERVGKGLAAQRRRDIVAQSLETADVFPLAGRRCETLSGGEQRRVKFARALAQLEAGRTVSERQALLLDEPIANLDLRHQILLLDAAKTVASRGVAVLTVLHDLNFAARYANTLAIMRSGAIVACGAPPRIMTRELLSQVFDIDLAVATSDGGLSIVPSCWSEREDARVVSQFESQFCVGANGNCQAAGSPDIRPEC